MTHILAIDQGTTSSRAIIFDAAMQPVNIAQQTFTQYYPQSGWVEHDVEEIWQSVLKVCQSASAGFDIAAIGITNQRETVVLWDKNTGQPVHRAIVWQDRRTTDVCEQLRAQGHEALVTATTGLLLDPYFSATKLAWLLNNIQGARARAQAGELLFGTIDSFLIWRLTEGKTHATDATNAARTMLYDIHQGVWSKTLCQLLDIPMHILPEVRDCASDFGIASASAPGAPGKKPILGVAGDQQAATIGQACFKPGMMKSTYGTGCFALLNTGNTAVHSSNRLLSTIAYQLQGQVTYALEGSIFIAGAVVQWLRDGLKMITAADMTQAMADAADDTQEVIIVPAFTGLGAPHWQPKCRGAIYGITRNTGPNELARAALQSVGYQTRDLLQAMRADWPGAQGGALRVDGGMSASDYTMQFLANVCGMPVERPTILETTALGVAWLAGMQAGIYPPQETFAQYARISKTFTPQKTTEQPYENWKKAVQATIQQAG